MKTKTRGARAEGGKNTLINDLTAGNVSRQLISFAAPLFLSGLLQTAYNAADMVIVGHFVGSAGLSAASTGGDVLIFLTFAAIGFSNAGQILISQFIGAERHDLVGRLIGTIFSFLLICSLVLTALCLLLRNQIIVWMQVPPEAALYSYHYVLTCTCGLFFIYGYNIVSAILRGMGNSRHPFLFISVAAVTNIALDLLFVAVFHWAVFGAALATVISQGVSFIWALFFLYRRREEFCFDFRLNSFRIDRELFPRYIRLGVPMMIQMAGITFSKLFISSWVNSYGVTASALNGIGNKLYTLTTAYSSAIQTSSASMIAQNLGARKHERVSKVIWTALIIGTAFAFAISLATILFPRAAFGMFTSDEAVLEMAVSGYIPVIVILYIGGALRAPMVGLINGSGNSRMNLAIAVLDGIVVRIGLALILGLVCGMGVYGFWYGSSISGFIPFLLGGFYFLSGKWKTKNLV